MLVIVQIFVSGECEDYSSGARVCAAIAEKVYKEMVKGGAEMLSILQKGENFEWSQSPPVSECVYIIMIKL